MLKLKPETTAAQREAILGGLATLPAAIPQVGRTARQLLVHSL
jgi:hypothetical protein